MGRVRARQAREVGVSSVVQFPYAPASVAAARGRLAADLREAGIFTPAIGDAALVVSELLSNAILHARPLPGAQVQVAWALSPGTVEVAVSDGGGATRPHTTYPSLSSVGGRGLAIVERLSERWGVRSDDSGTTVWAVLSAPRDRRRSGSGPASAGVGNGAGAGRRRA